MYRKQEKGWTRAGGIVKADSEHSLELPYMALC